MLRCRREEDFIRREERVDFQTEATQTGEGTRANLGLAGARNLAEESNVFIARLAESDGGDEAVRVGRAGWQRVSKDDWSISWVGLILWRVTAY